jgi:hypothetical protein
VYSIKSLFASNASFRSDTVRDGLAKLGDDILRKDLLKTYWLIWIPAQTLTFSVVPPHLRVLFVALVSFCWVTILSSISSSSPSPAAASSASSAASACSEAPPAEDSAILRALRRGTEALQRRPPHGDPHEGPIQPRRPAYVAVGASSPSSPSSTHRRHP